MYGIYTLYQIGKLSDEILPSIKEIEENVNANFYGNEVLISYLSLTRVFRFYLIFWDPLSNYKLKYIFLKIQP